MDFTNYLSSDYKFDLEAKILSNYIKIFLASFRDKISILEYLKQNDIQHYAVSYRQIPIKVVIRGFSRSADTELIKV